MVRTSRLSLVALLAVVLVAPVGAQAPAAAPRKKAPARRAAPAPATPTPSPAPPAADPAPLPPPTDVTIVTAVTQGAQVTTSTTYIRGPRQRTEFPGVVTLDQCDLQRTVVLGAATRKYRVQAYDQAAPPDTSTAPGAANVADPAGPAPRGGVVAITTTVTDTGERQTLFGLEARHVRTVVTRQPSKDACDKTPIRTEMDAWYVDLPPNGSACARPVAPPAADACVDRLERELVGETPAGLAVKLTTTVTSGDGDTQTTTTSATEVRKLAITRLDAALFDVPADFTETASLVDVAPTLGTGHTLEEALFGSTADGTGEAAPKAAGAIRIGVLEPVNRSGRAALQMRALRQELVTRLNRTPYEALALKGSSPKEITGDMTRMACDYVLLAEVVEAKTSKPGRVGGMLRAASGGDPARDRHEVKIAYRVFPADGTATIKAQGDARADNGGGFGLGSALRVAAFAGQLYMGFASAGMMRGMGGSGLGMGMGMMNPMMYGLGGGLGTGLGGGYGVPGLQAPDQAEREMAQVALQAAGEVGRTALDTLTKGRGGR